jgi:hypothetical protein
MLKQGEYTYTKLDNGRASMTVVHATGMQFVRTIHPYDLAEYHYATSPDGQKWHINRIVGRELKGFGFFTGTPDDVVTELRRRDAPIPAQMDRS